jgi:predicted small lipoprotein YifL
MKLVLFALTVLATTTLTGCGDKDSAEDTGAEDTATLPEDTGGDT